ncbi:hypothetical protein AVEN_147432-1 [Araneus ventricosus]|uniref:Uncharacterized protein n=1 Tax=Araneus ventricosus TaxID=182803 RepID=A0A4Y2DRB6_ARAVE|nr:hypothetical protein AVEN_147432-1 [Araneus ventricosus]
MLFPSSPLRHQFGKSFFLLDALNPKLQCEGCVNSIRHRHIDLPSHELKCGVNGDSNSFGGKIIIIMIFAVMTRLLEGSHWECYPYYSQELIKPVGDLWL